MSNDLQQPARQVATNLSGRNVAIEAQRATNKADYINKFSTLISTIAGPYMENEKHTLQKMLAGAPVYAIALKDQMEFQLKNDTDPEIINYLKKFHGVTTVGNNKFRAPVETMINIVEKAGTALPEDVLEAMWKPIDAKQHRNIDKNARVGSAIFGVSISLSIVSFVTLILSLLSIVNPLVSIVTMSIGFGMAAFGLIGKIKMVANAKIADKANKMANNLNQGLSEEKKKAAELQEQVYAICERAGTPAPNPATQPTSVAPQQQGQPMTRPAAVAPHQQGQRTAQPAAIENFYNNSNKIAITGNPANNNLKTNNGQQQGGPSH